MKKYIFLLFSFLVFAITANAQYKMVITLANGEKIEKEVWDIQNVAFEPLGSVATPDVQDAVDLGLSVKWAKWNIGASSEDEYGSYIAWGDPAGEDQSFDNSHYPNDYSNISGTKYDVATTQWGDKWRMPTPDEWKELDGLTKELVTLNNGITVFKVTAKNGNYIYLPRGGYQIRKGKQDVNKGADYWTSENT